MRSMATIKIGGVSVTGNNIEIRNGVVTVDGVVIEGVQNTSGASISTGGAVEVRVLEGRVENLKADGSIVAANVEGSVQAGGSVNCDAVDGSVSAGGSVNCDDVRGNVSAGGSVSCDDVGGNVTAMTVRRS